MIYKFVHGNPIIPAAASQAAFKPRPMLRPALFLRFSIYLDERILIIFGRTVKKSKQSEGT